jgi:hypothetical protein
MSSSAIRHSTLSLERRELLGHRPVFVTSRSRCYDLGKSSHNSQNIRSVVFVFFFHGSDGRLRGQIHFARQAAESISQTVNTISSRITTIDMHHHALYVIRSDRFKQFDQLANFALKGKLSISHICEGITTPAQALNVNYDCPSRN